MSLLMFMWSENSLRLSTGWDRFGWNAGKGLRPPSFDESSG